MFKRLILEDWHHWMPIIGFVLTFGVFIAIVVRTVRLKNEKVDRMARLPLENDQDRVHS